VGQTVRLVLDIVVSLPDRCRTVVFRSEMIVRQDLIIHLEYKPL